MARPKPMKIRYLYEFFVVLMFLLFAHAFYWIFLHSPLEAQMGIVQKIFYFHVPSAISMFLGLSVCAGASVVYLVFSRRKKGRGFWAGVNNFFVDRRDNVDALADSLTAGLAGLDFEPELVLASFHGLPRDYLDKGDPYHCHCQKTTRLLRETLGWPEERLKICFQSRFGKAEWLQPYFEETVTDLARSGTKRLAVIMPGFSADCLETLEEIAMRGGETFRESGGEDYAAIACLNDSEPGMRLIEHLARRELAGWI